jgi:hypothetical protein
MLRLQSSPSQFHLPDIKGLGLEPTNLTVCPQRVIVNAAERERPRKPAAEVAAVLLLQLLCQLGEEIGFTNQLSYDVAPGSIIARFLIFGAVIVRAATTVIIATKGQLGRAKDALILRPRPLI